MRSKLRYSDNLRHSLLKKQYIIIAIILLLLLVGYSFSKRSILVYDFTNPDTLKSLKLKYNSKYTNLNTNEKGLNIQSTLKGPIISPRTAIVIGPQLEQGANWQNTPFVKIEIAPSPWDRWITLSWYYDYPNDKDFFKKVRKVSAGQSNVIIDTQDFQDQIKEVYWYNINSDIPSDINRFGLGIQYDFSFKKISLSNYLSFLDWSQLIHYNLFIRENPIHTYSINFVRACRIGHVWFTQVLGMIIVLSGVLYFIYKDKKIILGAILVTTIFCDIYFSSSLFSYARDSRDVSSFHYQEYDEYRSRFGEELAKLNEELRARIPEGEKILFLPSSRRSFRAAASVNWLEKLYVGIYDYSSKNPNYILIFYPKNISVDSGNGAYQKLTYNKKIYSIEDIYKISDELRLVRVVP